MEFERLLHGAEESKKVCYYICKARQADDKCIGHQIPEKLLKVLIMNQLHLFITQLSDRRKVVEELRKIEDVQNPVYRAKGEIMSLTDKVSQMAKKREQLYADYVASAAPFGYQFDPDKKGAFIIDPPAAKIVRRIFDLAILGLGTREIAMMLNDENVPVPSVYNKENKMYGKETTYTIAPVILWDSSRVWKILTAYVYTGAMVLGKTKTLISGKCIIRNSSQKSAVHYGRNP